MNGNILIVDDDADSASCWRKSWAKLTKSRWADTATALKAAFSKEQPDVILLDYKMPDAAGKPPEDVGLSLIPLIKKEWPETEIIMMTGHASYEVAVHSVKLGAFHFFEKPFDPKMLVSLVEKAIRTGGPAEGGFARLRLSQRRDEECGGALSSAWQAATQPCSSPARAAPARRSWRIDPQLQPAHQRADHQGHCAAFAA